MNKLPSIFSIIPAAVLRGGIVASQSFQRHTIGRHFRPLFFSVCFLSLFCKIQAQEVVVKFHHTANGRPLVLPDSSYTNAFNEVYQVTRLKYYISHGGFAPGEPASAALIDASAQDSIVIHPKEGKHSALYFMVGVDSALNCSGAQDGALDPLNGMFWTWNSGYIFFKLEGYSSSSKADLQRIEHHVGGYRYPNNVAKIIQLNLPVPLECKKNRRYLISINVDMDKYWKGINDVKIADQALLMTPGGIALKAAENFPAMFSITSIE